MDISEKIAKLMKDRGDSQAKLAKAVGTHQSVVHNWLRKQGQPTLEKATVLARHYGIPLEWLIDDELEWPPAETSFLNKDELFILEAARRLGLKEAERRLFNSPVEIEKSDQDLDVDAERARRRDSNQT